MVYGNNTIQDAVREGALSWEFHIGVVGENKTERVIIPKGSNSVWVNHMLDEKNDIKGWKSKNQLQNIKGTRDKGYYINEGRRENEEKVAYQANYQRKVSHLL